VARLSKLSTNRSGEFQTPAGKVKKIILICSIITAALAIIVAGFFGLRWFLRNDGDGSGHFFRHDIPTNPRTLDPQTATGKTEALLIANLFDGLLKVDRDGKIIANIAAEYSVSADGLTYTFLLRDDVYWYYDGDYSVKCTAYDFVFAFRRLFNPAVKSENAPLFYSIKNARDVHRGAIPYLDAVGVEAFGEFELRITLEEPNPLLPFLLTTSPAMPCNEELFNKTRGRYGLNAASIPSNGAFFITQWNYDPFSSNNNIIIMRRHEKNSQAEQIFPRGLNFFIGFHDPLEHFLDETVQALIAEGEMAELLMSRGLPYDGFENSVWGLVFNTSRGRAFGSEDLRFALAASIDRDALNVNKTGWSEARDLIPPGIHHTDEPYRTLAGEASMILFNPEAARLAYERGAAAAGRENLVGLDVIIPVDENNTAHEYLSRILQHWQVHLGFFCSIRTLSIDDFNEALSSGSYDIAMARISGEFNSPDAYLRAFGGAIRRSTASPSIEFHELLTEARRTYDMQESARLYKQAENMILEQAVFIPVCYQTEMFFYNRKSEGLVYNPFTGAVIFRDAKWF
jgi:oligopeptide transport system substrate-binding protein